MKKKITNFFANIGQGLKAEAEISEYRKSGRYLREDPEHPNTFRPGLEKPKRKPKTAAALIAAATLATSAQAGLLTPAGGDSANSGSTGSFWGNVWSAISGFFGGMTTEDVAQGLADSNTNPISATANDAAYALQQAQLNQAKKDK